MAKAAPEAAPKGKAKAAPKPLSGWCALQAAIKQYSHLCLRVLCKSGEKCLQMSWGPLNVFPMDFNAMYPAAMTLPMPNGPCVAVALPEENAARLSWLHETCLSSLNWESDAEESYLLLVDYDFPPELHDHLDWAPPARMKVGKGLYGHRGHGGAPRPLPVALQEACALPRHARRGGRGRHAAQVKFLRDVLGARVWWLHRAYRFTCSPFMELKHSERRQLKTAGSVVAEKVVKLTQNAIFGRCCMNPDKFRNTNTYVDPAKFKRAVGKSSVTNFELQINDLEGSARPA